MVRGDVFLLDDQGYLLAEVKGLKLRQIGKAQGADAEVSREHERPEADWLYDVEWKQAPVPEATARAGTWVIFADKGGAGESLAALMEQRGLTPLLVFAGEAFQDVAPNRFLVNAEQPEHLPLLLEKAFGPETKTCDGVVHLWSLDAEPAGDWIAEALDRAIPLTCSSVSRVVGDLTRQRGKAKLFLVTRGARWVEGVRPASLLQTATVGVGLTLIQEHQELNPTLVDLAVNGDPAADAEILFREVAGGDAEDQVAWRDGRRWVPRVVRVSPETLADPQDAQGTRLLSGGREFRLEVSSSGTLDGLAFRRCERRKPGRGEVEIEIEATGLNFSDVMKAMHLYPGVTDDVVPLGIECAGRVVAVGEGVEKFAVGDEVMALAPYCFARHAVAPEFGVLPKPAGMSFAEAATLPVAYATAYYALHHLAQLAPGEKVLIHAAAGGVGQAAIQIARRAGAEVFATAGTPEKREYLQSLGVQHVFDSRGVKFADEIRQATGGKGVDVVLNSLAGDAIARSLGILAPYGRFLELGKTDIYMNRMIGLEPFQNNLSYFAIDMDRLYRQKPAKIAQVLAELDAHFAAGDYRALPVTEFDATHVTDAFRYMRQRKNIGKVVVRMAAGSGKAPAEGATIRPDATYLVTGGLGSLGLKVAEWLADEGARHLVLTGRGSPTAEAEAVLAHLRERGVAVEVSRCDVAQEVEVEALFRCMRGEMPPLRGIFHLAGVLDDGLAVHLTREQYAKALAPKVLGAWNLHTAAQDTALDLFVLFSSASSVLGSAGQGNYAAGNAFLDALAQARRLIGQPALSVSWGPWEAGLAAADVRRKEMARRGFRPLDAGPALEVLRKLLGRKKAHMAVMSVDWKPLLKQFVDRQKVPPIVEAYADLGAPKAAEVSGQADDFRSKLQAVPPAKRGAFLADHFVEQMAQVTCLNAGEINRNEPLGNLGVDSLMLFELKRRIETSLQVTIPTGKLFENPSITELAEFVLEL
jgi:NADPH:quinone reductase-like Zn-dependent oxidoreductase